MVRIGGNVSAALLAQPSIATVEQQVGRAELGEDAWGPQRSEFHVELEPVSAREQEAAEQGIRATLEGVPGIQSEVVTFLGDRISETIAGETAPVVVSIFGDDLDLLDAKAQEVASVLRTVAGAKDVQVKAPPGTPRLAIKLRAERLVQFGYRPVDVLEAIQAAFQGTIVAQTYQGSRVSNVAVILDDPERRDPETIGALLLRNANGLRLPLSELADVYSTSGRHSILHEGTRRRQTVTCNPRERDVASFVADAKHAVASKVGFPAGVYVLFSGAAQAREQAQRQLLVHSLIAAAGILLLLATVYRSWRNLLLILANMPFALVGGVLAVWLTGSGLTIGALVGFVTLFGVTTRNSIMMISHFEHLVQEEGVTWGRDAAMRGASERLLPILMTALVTALGLLPLAVGSGEAGREIEGPMAVVILGGLITSTILNLVVLPTLALQYGRFEPTEPIPD